jgi:tetratricopeptide (TPR) repeat protein
MQGLGPGGQSAQGIGIAQADRGGVATVNITQVYQAALPAPIPPEEVETAEQRLQAMPLDNVPAPAGLPPGSWMPLRRNALFVGREGNLRALASALRAGGTAAVGPSTAVTGLGGVGKSQLASEFVYCYGQYFSGGVFWLSCADPDAIPAEIATSGRRLGLHADFANLPLDAQVGLVASAWHSDLPRLLVLDNCEDEAVLDTWLPRGGGCRVLVTSRRDIWSLHVGVHKVSLGVLARAESLDLLCKHRPDLAPDDPALDALAKELGDLPLALHLAGSFLARYRHASSGEPAAYLKAVRHPDVLKHRSLTIEGASPTGHEQHVARTFALSYDRLQPSDDIDAMALVTLARAAWFAPGEPIPRNLLRASAEVDDANESAILRFEDGLARLRELGLISEQGDGGLVLHRLLAAFVRSEAGSPDTYRVEVEAAVLAAAQRVNQGGYPAPLLAWQPQLRFVAERAVEKDSAHGSDLLSQLGNHLAMVADFEGARAAYERALRIDEACFGADHPNVAIHVNNLGIVLRDLGDLAGARVALERAHMIDEACFGPDHPKVVASLNNLGVVLQDLGDLAGARVALERSLRIDEACFGPDHPNVAIHVNNLGKVLCGLGDLAGARAAFERALRIDEACFGPDHPNVAMRVSNLGNVLGELGDPAAARAALERVLRIDEACFGPDHPNVAIHVSNLGVMLRELGDLAGAMAASERALRIHEASFGLDHPNIVAPLRNLGLTLQVLGDLAGARAVFKRALAIGERTLGPDHPNTRAARGNLEGLSGD